MDCSKTEVHNAIAKYQDDGYYSVRNKMDAPDNAIPTDDCIIKFHNLRQVHAKKVAQPLRGTYVCHRTISRRLVNKFHLRACKSA